MKTQSSRRSTLFIQRQSQLQVAMALIEAAEQSTYTRLHSKRVAKVARKVAIRLHWPGDQMELLSRAATLHDIGKISIPAEITLKKGALTDTEYTLMKEHPLRGYNTLRSLGLPMEALITLQHHERVDGHGYPDGLKGNKILKHARIIAVADVLDALISERPYGKMHTVRQALKVLRQESGKAFDPQVVELVHGEAEYIHHLYAEQEAMIYSS